MSVTGNNNDVIAGNIYTVPLSENEYFSFRVLLHIEKQCIKPKKLMETLCWPFKTL